MEPYEEATHSFVIRVWSEGSDHAHSRLWRGHITHVPTGEQRYCQNLDEISDFIAEYLDQMNRGVGLWEWLLRMVGQAAIVVKSGKF